MTQLFNSPTPLWNPGTDISALYSSHGYIPYCLPTAGSIIFGYRDPSVRPSNDQARKTRGPGLWSGRFASKSEQTPATISLQCRRFIRVVLARRASKTPNALSQDSYVAFTISGVNLAVTG